MKQPTFLEGALLALIASISGSVLFSGLNLILPADTLLRLLISLLSLAYLSYLMTRSRERLGRITTFSSWLLATVTGLLLAPSLLLFLLLHCGLIWIVRSLYIHNGVLAAVADLAMTALSLAAAVWATLQSGSLFLTIWCFFLTQSLFVAIPKSWSGKQLRSESVEEGFNQAWQSAQKALSKMVSNQEVI